MRYFGLLLFATSCYASADLEMKELNAVVADDGKAVTLKFVVSNHGPENADAIRLRISLFQNRELLQSAEHEITPQERDTDREGSLEIELTGPVSSITAEVFDMQQPDIRPSNNTKDTELRIAGGSLVDLEVLEGTILTAQPVKDKKLVLSVQLANHGPEMVRSSRVVADLMLFQKTVATTEKRLGKLAAGDKRDQQLAIAVPRSFPSTEGVVMIRWLPADSDVVDSSLSNNSYSIAVILVARQADLMPHDVKVDSRGELRFVIKNKGNAPAASSTTAVFLNGALVRRFNTPDLSAGAERRHQYGGTKIRDGAQVTIVADYNADVAEASEENNRFQFVSN